MSVRGPLEDALRRALASALDVSDGDLRVTVDADGWSTARSRPAKVKIKLAEADDDAPDGGQDEQGSEDPVNDHTEEHPDDPTPDDVDAVDEAAPAAEDDEPSGSAGDADQADDGPTPEELDEEADAAADFLEALLDSFDLPGDLKIRVGDDHAEVEIVEVDGGALIGRRGQTLDAIQELVRCSLQRQFQRRTRVRIDVEGYRARRMEKLEEKTADAIEEVLDTGKSVRMEPMDVFERKVVHGMVAKQDGVDSHSQGREPGRRVIIEPV
ncbi:MAG: R3H domain-containing nucleic acid-binding protein [Nitriliruptorales bacterium]|nr:R3H domain-containing nucleic acid-binding protein [Nitriliruptorales bacterium]